MAKDINVLKATSGMLGFITRENCTIDPELRIGQGFDLKQQCRLTLKSNPNIYGLVTLHSDYQDGSDDDDIRMSLAGRERFNETDSFDASIDHAGVKQGKTKAWLESNNEFGELLDVLNGAKVVFCAPHGGAIEKYTDLQAESAYSRMTDHHAKAAACWRCCGWQTAIGAYDAWHITSTDISRTSFPQLNRIGDRGFECAVAFHGYGEDAILIGGSAPADVKSKLRAAIETACAGNIAVTIATSGAYSGTDPENFVNWLSLNGAGGIQIEQPLGARKDYGTAIAWAVADVLAAFLY